MKILCKQKITLKCEIVEVIYAIDSNYLQYYNLKIVQIKLMRTLGFNIKGLLGFWVAFEINNLSVGGMRLKNYS